MSRLVLSLVIASSLASCSLVLPNDGLSGGGAGAAGAGGSGGSTLPSPNLIDCLDPATAGDLRCRAIDTLAPGSVGAGPAIDWTGVPRQVIIGGFVESGRLVLAVQPSSHAAVGGLVSVDLATGERRLIAGQLRLTDYALLTQGQGWGFQGMVNVVPAGSMLQAHTVDEFGFGGFIIDVDPVSGDRPNARPVGTQCEQVLAPDFFPQENRHPALAPDTTVYLLGDSIQGQGIVEQIGESCELIVPLQAGQTGFDPNFLVWHQGKLWSVDSMGKALTAIDLSTSAVDLISGPDSVPPGTSVPLGIHDAALRDDRIFTIGGDFQHRISEVNRTTGARSSHAVNLGPLRTAPQTAPRVWMHPTLEALIIAFDGAVVLYDPATDRANTLSY